LGTHNPSNVQQDALTHNKKKEQHMFDEHMEGDFTEICLVSSIYSLKNLDSEDILSRVSQSIFFLNSIQPQTAINSDRPIPLPLPPHTLRMGFNFTGHLLMDAGAH
jgi:hypothetical protein